MLDKTLLGLTHQEQQKAVEKIQQLMAEGVSVAQAIAIVAKALREQKNKNTD